MTEYSSRSASRSAPRSTVIDLTARLEARTADLERLSARMIQQHEEQRGRLARELHDETAQVFAALKLQLGSLRESVPPTCIHGWSASPSW